MKTRNIALTLPAAFASASAAHGSIIHTEVNQFIPVGEEGNFDLTGDGVDNFSLGFIHDDLYTSVFQSLDGGLTQALTYEGSTSLYGFLGPSWSEDYVGPAEKDQEYSPGPATQSRFPIGYKGDQTLYWWNPYFGMSVDIDGETHYGWARTSVVSSDDSFALHVIEFAYESEPNTPIAVGAVPAPGTLALLALGAAAGSRRKRIAA